MRGNNLETSLQATVKKVEKIGGELVWVRGVAIGLFAMLGLIVTQLFIMQNSISTIGTELSVFKVDVQYKFTAIDNRLTGLDSRLTDLETEFSEFKEGQLQIAATLEKVEQRLEALEHQSRQR